eukprot:TRINITY_DN16761_c0_g1_i3.p2 TRINITY_DN16761_c0_g1~~TRINITY_DN16761_c0_g1_i3.p2  ORF type:complete len:128 (+),score=27.50 TRINITY_DN16761_c0_g1_i3:251-634(+)
MGHEGCGAVKAAGLPQDAIANEPKALGNLLNNLKRGLDHDRLGNISDTRAYDREAVVTNAKAQLQELSRDAGVMKKIEGGELLVVGAFYEISSGIVDFFSELTPQQEPGGFARQASEGVRGTLPATK